MALPDSIQHIIYENEIPPDVGLNLGKIYQSSFCVIKYFEIFRGIDSPNAMVISCGEPGPRHIIAYSISGKEITVLNELVEIERDYVQYFADTVFNKYPAITTVNFNCIKNRITTFQYPWRLWKTSQDVSIILPPTFEAYHAKLGRQTQKHIKYYLNRLQREYADFTFQAAATHEIEPGVISRIIEMNRLRMQSKNIRSGFDNLFKKRIMEFCRDYGLVSTVSIQGKIVAGAICYEVGNQAYLEAIAHDPDYNKYNVGQVCLYLTVKYMIEKGRDSFHMLWGENEYKYRFLGVKQDLYYISIYKSYSSKLMSIPKLAQHTYSYLFRQLDYLTKKYIINRYRQKKCR
jgi:hypothetical protein